MVFILTSSILFSLCLTVAHGVHGPACFHCSRIPYPRDCDYITRCEPSDVCSTRLILSDSGFTNFEQGCMEKQKCTERSVREITNTTADILDDQPGDLTICEECCVGEFCNSQGCGSAGRISMSERGPMCFSCHQHKRDMCSFVTQCRQGEECFTRKHVSQNGDILYESGCKTMSMCQSNTWPVLVGKRSESSSCTDCCSGDYCNRNCSSLAAHPLTALTTASSQTGVHTTKPTKLTPKQQCDDHPGFIFVERSTFTACYKDKQVHRKFDAALVACRHASRGGSLLTIHNDAELAYFTDVVFANHDNCKYWVGASDATVEGQWVWLDGTPVQSQLFDSGQPNGGSDQNCGALFYSVNQWKLYDVSCEENFYVVCEIPLTGVANNVQPVQTTPVLNTASTLPPKPSPPKPTNPTTLAPPLPNNIQCRNDDYTQSISTGICYKVYNLTKTYSDARTICASQNADLLILRNQDVELYFTLQFYDSGLYHQFFLGGHRNNTSNFIWNNGLELDANLQWRPGQPSDDNNKCLALATENNAIALNDVPCDNTLSFICEEKCPDRSYTYFPDIGYCIKSYTDSVSWEVAQKLCRAEGADLIEPTTTTKITILQWLMRNKADGTSFWVGASDKVNNGQFEWLNSKDPIPAINWQPGEPSIHVENEHCAALSKNANNVLLSAINCHISRTGFVCQYIW